LERREKEMANYQAIIDKVDQTLIPLNSKIKQVRKELKLYEFLHALYVEVRVKAQRQITPVIVLPTSATSKRPENIARNIVAKAKALPYEERKQLIKALEGGLE